MSERLRVLIQKVCPSGKGVPTLFKSSEPKPHDLFPRAIIDCLREAKSFLQIECANESSFAKTIQLFVNPDACSSEMRLHNCQRIADRDGHRGTARSRPGGDGGPSRAVTSRCSFSTTVTVTLRVTPASRRQAHSLLLVV
jgi:hypothetical protein